MAKHGKKDKQKSGQAAVAEGQVLSVDEAAAVMQADEPQSIEVEGEVTKISDLKQTSRATADCMTAKENSCSCRCRGKYHGKEHPKGWKDEEGCEPLNEAEKKEAKKQALYAWRKAHPERVSAYMKQWREAKKEAAAAEGTDEESLTEEAEEIEEGETADVEE